ncbi:MAG: UDP-N-acetylmuramoyl-L-alanyl-D-glutamate--2,6-diaminopimelate ligase [Actinomycetota bacterium]|nr:UDP-N-acetylmuramoyl-L-alanyl-D-glutamate--2,6-diaminopimelate ligase [Actinomycetota bacterium]
MPTDLPPAAPAAVALARPRTAAVSLRTVARWVSGTVRGPDAEVTGLTLNSRLVEPGDLYAALPGSRVHGAEFAAAALRSGAAGVLTDPAGAGMLADADVAVCVVERPRSVLGALAARLYDDPAAALTTVGITGTHGKTTTTYMCEAGLRGAGVGSGVIGTVGTRIDGRFVKTTLTTPEAPELHAMFALMREQGVRACAMEVSSHALVMGRVDGVVYDLAVFLNLGRDHLDFHRDVEDYFQAKASLFTPQRAARALVNVDDAHGRRLVEEAGVPVRTMSADGRDADWRAVDVRLRADGADFDVLAPDGSRHRAGIGMPGPFNVANALAAIAALAEVGYPVEPVVGGLSGLTGVPGRIERVDAGQDFVTVVDYAHKPDAVTAVLTALRTVTPGRVVTVIGAGGDRDRGKRPMMGAAASRLSDVLVVTDDNPRTEDPAHIRAELLAGARDVAETERAELMEIGDRRAAIRQAVALARPGDCVLVAGKGHEQGQEVAGVVHPFDDRVVVWEALTEGRTEVRRGGATR